VVVRKRPIVTREHDTFPLVILSPQQEKIHAQQFERGVQIDYPVAVVILPAKTSNPASAAELQALLDRREEARDALWKPYLSGVSTVMDTQYEPSPAFDLGGLDHLFDVSLQLFTFRDQDTRDA
jgi:hypothetical protein